MPPKKKKNWLNDIKDTNTQSVKFKAARAGSDTEGKTEDQNEKSADVLIGSRDWWKEVRSGGWQK